MPVIERTDGYGLQEGFLRDGGIGHDCKKHAGESDNLLRPLFINAKQTHIGLIGASSEKTRLD